MTIAQNELLNILNYNDKTGIFTWKNSESRKIRVGSIAGCFDKDKYIQIRINNRSYRAHRLAWLYVYGELPLGQIDHIDGNPSNNAIENLRIVSPRENNQNRKEHRNGHLVGTTYNKNAKKWQAQISINGKNISLGYYDTQKQANDAYIIKERTLNNET